jgi:hypothetical protein
MTNLPEDNPVSSTDMSASSAAKRMERFAALQRAAFALLKASPEGYRHFWQRNLRKRRVHASF